MVEKFHTAGWWPNLIDPLRQLGERVADWFAPRSEASVEGEVYEIAIELPGVRAEDIEVSVRDDALTVRGEKRAERSERGRSYFFTEREYGAFERSFRLPPDADQAKISADVRDGVLTLRVAKRADAPGETRRIAITRG